MKIREFTKVENQVSQIGRHEWSVSRLIELSKNFPIMEININHMNVWSKYKDLSLREMVMHMKAVLSSDLSFPIILDEDGDIMDGRHRIMKALLEGKETILAVRFDENPSPCKINEEKSE